MGPMGDEEVRQQVLREVLAFLGCEVGLEKELKPRDVASHVHWLEDRLVKACAGVCEELAVSLESQTGTEPLLAREARGARMCAQRIKSRLGRKGPD